MIEDNIFDSHNQGIHLEIKNNECLLCTSRNNLELSDLDTLNVYTHIKELIRSNSHYSLSGKFAFQLVTNLEKNLRYKLFDEAMIQYGK